MARGPNPNSLANLKRGPRFDSESAKEAGRNSAKSRRRKRAARDIAWALASGIADVPNIEEYVEKFGAADEEISNLQIAIIKSVVAPALQGDRDALLKWLEILGEDIQTQRDKARYAHEMELLKAQAQGSTTGDVMPRIIRAENGELYVEDGQNDDGAEA